MKNQIKRILLEPKIAYPLSVSVFVILSLLLVRLSVTPTDQAEKMNLEKPTIVLVNEDIPSKFNGKTYQFGKGFVDLVSSDDTYNWQVAGRAVADRSYSDGSIDAIIYLPTSLSKDILTLQDIEPMQAQVNYKLQNHSNELSAKTLQGKVVDALHLFNQSVVKMYYASVAGNIAEAENMMSNSLGNQTNLVEGLTNQVNVPFKDSLPNYSLFISGASSLMNRNKGNISMQNSFTKGATDLLKASGDSFSSQLPEITAYFEQQNQIATVNATNSTQATKLQAESDEKFYFTQFSDLHGKTLEKILQFSSTDEKNTTTGKLSDLQTKVLDYNQLLTKMKESLETQIITLADKRNILLSLERDLYSQFFKQHIEEITQENFEDFSERQTPENAKMALANKLQGSFEKKDYLTDSGLLKTLENLIATLSIEAQDYKFDTLKEKGSLSGEAIKSYEEKLKVIGNYAEAYNLPTGSISLVLPENEEVMQEVTQKISVVVPQKTTYQSSALPDGLRIKDSSGLLNERVITLENTGENAKTYEIRLEVELGSKTSEKLEIEWKNLTNGEKIFKSTLTFGLLPRAGDAGYYEVVGGDKFEYLTNLLGGIDRAIELILTFYTEPGTTYLDLLETKTAEAFQEASKNSIYNLYGNMSLENFSSRLNAEDVSNFAEMGEKNLRQTIETIKGLNDSISNLSTDQRSLSQQLPEEYFANMLKELERWFTETSGAIEKNYQAWQRKEGQTMPTKDWSEYDRTTQTVYTNSNNALQTRIQTMLTSTATTVETLSQSAQAVKDNSKDFEELVKSAENTQKDAKDLLTKTETLVKDGNIKVDKSKDYYSNFSQVLVNTRTKGVDNRALYDFFVNPISTENITPTQTTLATVNKSFDFRWFVATFIGIGIGGFGVFFGQKISLRKK